MKYKTYLVEKEDDKEPSKCPLEDFISSVLADLQFLSFANQTEGRIYPDCREPVTS